MSKVFWYDDKDLEKNANVDDFYRFVDEVGFYALDNECVCYVLSSNTGAILAAFD